MTIVSEKVRNHIQKPFGQGVLLLLCVIYVFVIPLFSPSVAYIASLSTLSLIFYSSALSVEIGRGKFLIFASATILTELASQLLNWDFLLFITRVTSNVFLVVIVYKFILQIANQREVNLKSILEVMNGYFLLGIVYLGINAYYMFGSLNHYKSTSFDNSTTITGSTQINSIVASKFRFRYGAQFYNTFAKKHDVTLGLIFEPKVKLNGDYSQITTGVTTDTTANAYSSSDFELPMMFGVGLYYTYDKKISRGLDYSLQDWKNAKYYAKTESLSNRSKLAVGLEFIPNPIGRKFSDRVRYRAGFNMSDAYYKIDGNMPNKNFGITFGLGLPLRNSNTVINATVEYGKIGGVSQLNEDYLKFTFNAIFNEHWFFKRKL